MAGLRSLLINKCRKKKTGSRSTASPASSPRRSSSPAAGVSTPTHLQELETVFKKFDVNGDGKISCGELGAIMASLGHPCTDEELQCMVREADADGDGFIDLAEFVEINTRGVDVQEAMEDLRDAFLVYDVDGNGVISAEELHQVLESLGERTTLAECKEMIRGVDSDGDGQVNFDEFKMMMTKSLFCGGGGSGH